MSFTVSEKYISRRNEEGSGAASVELRYVLQGTGTDAEAKAALKAEAPTTYDGLIRSSVGVDEEDGGGGIWTGYVRYSPNSIMLAAGDERFAFSTSGGTQHIVLSRAITQRYGIFAAGPTDYGGLIGVTRDGEVKGEDIGKSVFTFQVTRAFVPGDITEAFQNTLADATWCTNAGSFRGYPAGEVIFMGVEGTERADGLHELTFHFARVPNRTGITLGEMTGIAVKGWEVIDVFYEPKLVGSGANSVLAEYPVGVQVHRVYESVAYSSLGIDT